MFNSRDMDSKRSKQFYHSRSIGRIQMKKLLIPVIMLIVGLGSGVGAGLFLKPPPEASAEDPADESPTEDSSSQAPQHSENIEGREFAKLANQFVVPVVSEGKVTGLVVLSISLEVPAGGIEAAFAIEPRLRDGFLQVLFDHANVGGFSENFTSATNMRVLREELVRSAIHLAGDKVTDVLILDIVRQDV
jgi:hypothetical protein